MRNTGTNSGPGLQTVERAVSVLSLFSAEVPELGLTQLAARMQVTKPTAHRLARSLVQTGLLEQDPRTRGYRLGLRLLELANVVRAGLDVRTQARGSMEELSRQFGETVYLLVRRDDRVVCVDRIEGTHPLRDLSSPPGTSGPLHVGAGGTAMLAALRPGESAELLAGLPAGRRRTVRERVAAAAERGYALVDDDVATGVAALAVAVLDATGEPVAAISVGGLSERVLGQEQPIARATTRAARTVRTSMGWGPTDEETS